MWGWGGGYHIKYFCLQSMPFIWLSYQEGGIKGRAWKEEIKGKLAHAAAERQKRDRKWGELGVEEEKEKHPGFACPVIIDGFLLRHTDRQRRRDGVRIERKEGGKKQERCYGFW